MTGGEAKFIQVQGRVSLEVTGLGGKIGSDVCQKGMLMEHRDPRRVSLVLDKREKGLGVLLRRLEEQK